MVKNKGFTLVELLAVIVILSVIALIAVPNVTGLLNKSKDNMFCKKVESIEGAAKYFAQDYSDDKTLLNFTTNALGEEVAEVTVATLLNKGYLKEDDKGQKNVDDPRDKTKSLLNTKVQIKIINDRYYGIYPLSTDEKKLCNRNVEGN